MGLTRLYLLNPKHFPAAEATAPKPVMALCPARCWKASPQTTAKVKRKARLAASTREASVPTAARNAAAAPSPALPETAWSQCVRLATQINKAAGRGWISETWRQLPVPALAVACFALAQALGGSGFIAAFVGSLLFGAIAKEHKPKYLLAAEGTGDTLSLLTWVVFGAVVVGQSIDAFSWQVLLYAVLSLTVVRMLPVFLVLGGLQLHSDQKLFAGWFGPRGLASIVFAVIVLNEHLPGGHTIAMTAVCAILLSVILHGMSANPLVAALGARMKQSDT